MRRSPTSGPRSRGDEGTNSHDTPTGGGREACAVEHVPLHTASSGEVATDSPRSDDRGALLHLSSATVAAEHLHGTATVCVRQA